MGKHLMVHGLWLWAACRLLSRGFYAYHPKGLQCPLAEDGMHASPAACCGHPGMPLANTRASFTNLGVLHDLPQMHDQFRTALHPFAATSHRLPSTLACGHRPPPLFN